MEFYSCPVPITHGLKPWVMGVLLKTVGYVRQTTLHECIYLLFSSP